MNDFFGFQKKEFIFDGQNALVVLPKKSNGRLVLKTEYFGAFPEVEVQLVKNGFTLAHVRNTNRWGTEDNVDRQAAFIKRLAEEYHLNPKAVLVGMSCGGMQAVYLAAKYPECVSVMYLDAPVMNFCSCPGNMGIATKERCWEEFYNARRMSRSELLIYREHPMDKLPQLKEHNIPVILVYGDSDENVPYIENGIMLERFYRENNLCIKEIGKEGCGHHPHGLEDPKPIVDFIMEHTK
ncbi:MAG: alpha/beta hydrolase [Lachnospiraceae bacterium]|nr:alpha/beta hydrolase [Lachnospiraceae bacterium]